MLIPGILYRCISSHQNNKENHYVVPYEYELACLYTLGVARAAARVQRSKGIYDQ